jgi:hypothetical protein
MTDREFLLAKLAVGDIFHAEYPNGALCICLVLSVAPGSIIARRITSQENLKFDRQTGVEKVADEEPQAIIISVAPLPSEIHNVFVALDQKYGAVRGQDDIFEKNPEYFTLSEVEKNAIVFINSRCASNPLPP